MRKLRIALVCGTLLLAALLSRPGARAADPPPSRGRELYARHCAACHGAEGLGDGVAAYLLSPRPRNFARGEFRLVRTTNGIPTDEDLYQVITNGMPGSAMPPHDRLSEADRRLIAQTVRALWSAGLRARYLAEGESEEDADTFVVEDTTPGAAIPFDGETEPSVVSTARGRLVYFQACASCHGVDGRGGTTQQLVDSEGNPAPARDFTQGVFKGGSDLRGIFARLRGGMRGTAMPTFGDSALSRSEAWEVAHFVRSLVPPGAQARVAQTTKTITARRVQALPEDGAAWQAVPAEYLALMPLWWRDARIEGVLVQAAHDGKELAIRLTWDDLTRDATILRPQEFQDGAAVQWSASDDPPFFGMGDAGGSVAIWSWKAAHQEDAQGFRDIEAIYPGLYLDHYPYQRNTRPGERPDPAAVSAPFHDPRFLTGWGAGNPLSQPEHAPPAEVAAAKGLGTLTTDAPELHTVRGEGRYDRNVWTLVLLAPLREGAQAPRSIAFAIWDGAQGDRNGQKSVTVWHRFAKEE
ncbi:MAG: c-type cytochrome [Planctomycetaceae bacterium]